MTYADLRRLGFGHPEGLAEVGIDGVVGLALALWRLNPVADADSLLFFAVVLALELVDGLGGRVDGEVSQ